MQGEVRKRGKVGVRRISNVLADNALLTIVLSSTAAVLLVAGSNLVVPDTWMTLVAGREILQHGLPHHDQLTVLGQGRTWVDQQWGAQVLLYGADRAGGLRLVTILTTVAIISGFAIAAAAARASGASLLATALTCEVGIVAAPWAWQARAQSLAFPLFAAALWLLLDGQRHPRPRTLLVLPLLVVWANVHGTVLLGALLVVAAGLLDLVRRNGGRPRAVALLAVAPLCLLASPYAKGLPGYYVKLVASPPFSGLIDEWRRTGLEPRTVVFWGLAGVTVALAIAQRHRIEPFEAVSLAIVLASAVLAVRGIPLFALAVAAIAPRLADGVTGWKDTPGRRPVNLSIAFVSLGAVALALLFVATRPAPWFEHDLPTERLPAIDEATSDPATRVLATTHVADWLLWRDPSLRGRLAYDVRYEIYRRATLEAVKAFEEDPSTSALDDGYGVLVLGTRVIVRPTIP